MSAWPRWNRSEDPAGLTRYVQRGVVRRLLRASLARDLPGPTGKEYWKRVQALYEVFAQCGIGYVLQDPATGPDGQAVRPPDHVLLRPGQGTCLDLSVLFAGACLDAALHPVVVVTEPRWPGDTGHVLVVVWLGGDWGASSVDYPLEGRTYPSAPGEMIANLRTDEDLPGTFVAVDVTLAAHGVPGRPGPASWAEAVASGTAELTASVEPAGASSRIWGTGVDVGRAYPHQKQLSLPEWPSRPVLSDPYQEDTAKRGPLSQLWARRRLVPFRGSDLFTILEEGVRASRPGRPRVAILHGAGGAGKTRAAAELAFRFDEEGWYTGFLRRDATPSEFRWLRTVRQPLLMVVDYAEAAQYETRVEQETTDRTDHLVRGLLGELQEREEPTCLLLTARGDGSWWEHGVGRSLDNIGYPYDLWRGSFPDVHPDPRGVLGEAFRAFAKSTALKPHLDENLVGDGRWTTLDLVMHAWLSAQDSPVSPADREMLYEEVLTREMNYWNDVLKDHFGRRESPDLLRRVAAGVTLTAPSAERLAAALERIPDLDGDGDRRDRLTALLGQVLPSDPGERGLALRPDPIGDHLVAVTMTDRSRHAALGPTGTAGGEDPAEESPAGRAVANPLFGGSLATDDPVEHDNVLQSVTRSAQIHPERAAALAEATLALRPPLWRPALKVATAQGGPYLRVLRRLAGREDPAPLDLAEAAASLPLGYATVAELALVAAERTHPGTPAEDAPEAALADHARNLGVLSHRNRDVGRFPRALELARERTALLRGLRASPGGEAYRTDLVTALHDLAVHLGDNGETDAAVEAAREAYELFGTLDGEDAGTGGFEEADLLIGLAAALSESGEHHQALSCSRKALARLGPGFRSEPAQYRPRLARALHNLALHLDGTGDSGGAAESAGQAVFHYRILAGDSPALYRPELAGALNNLASLLAATGHYEEAVSLSEEVLPIHRELADSWAPAHRAALASSLVVYSQSLGAAGRDQEALGASLEGVALRRQLAEEVSGVHLPPLAEELNILATRQLTAGLTADAERTAAEAVRRYRSLAEGEQNRHEGRAGLVRALNNHALCLYEGGVAEQGLVAAAEAVRICRSDPGGGGDATVLAQVLATMAEGLAATGDHEQAVAAVAEAVDLLRVADAGDPKRLADLARLLHHMADAQAERGEYAQSVAAATEAVELYRVLAQDLSDTYRPGLASALTSLGTSLAAYGEAEEAVEIGCEVVDLYARLVADRREPPEQEALALGNLSARLAQAGRPEQAADIGGKAVSAYRDLFRKDPRTYGSELARCLSNLSLALTDTGREEEARAAVEEALALYRAVAEDPVAAGTEQRGGLAMALSCFAALEPVPGREEELVAQQAEAAALYRDLDRQQPGAYREDLAGTLNGLATALTRAGRHAEALRYGQEAVGIQRGLAECHREAHTPGLADVLVDLSQRLAVLGRRAEAEEAVREGVDLHLALTVSAPRPHLARLLNALRVWSDLDAEAGAQAFDEATDALPPGPGAHVLCGQSLQRLCQGHTGPAIAVLTSAAHLADQETDPRWRSEARLTVRGVVDELPEDVVGAPAELPHWAIAPWDQTVGKVLTAWGEAGEWPEREELLREHYALLTSPAGRDTRELARLLYPFEEEEQELESLIDRIADEGFEEVIARERDDYRHTELVRAWTATPTWQDSYDFLVQHPEVIDDPRTRHHLGADPEDPVLREHLDLLELFRALPLNEVHEALIDQEAAAVLVARLVEAGQTRTLATLWRFTPGLADLPFTGDYAKAVLIAVEGSDPAAAREAVDAAAAQATPDQREAGAIRLRRLVRTRPEHGALLSELARRLHQPKQ